MDTKSQQNGPIHAFVVGVARSGTSAMTRLLNAHPRVCIGMERYKTYYRRNRRFPPELLTKERFLSVVPDDTNHSPDHPRWAKLFKSIEEKWDDAAVIGDKEGYAAMDFIVREIPDARFIFMLRDPNQVASSWNVRAARGERAWPDINDFRLAVNRWNEANSIAYLYSQQLGDRLLVLDFEKFFSGSQGYMSLLRFLGVESGPRREFMKAFTKSVRHYQEVVSHKQPMILEGQKEFVEREANMKTYRLLADMAEEQAAKLSKKRKARPAAD